MGGEFNEKSFEVWLIMNKQFSKKAARDAVSRLRRSQKLIKIEGFNNSSDYENALERVLEISEIPEASQKGMLRAVRLFYQYKIS
jgi:hypothetical protein